MKSSQYELYLLVDGKPIREYHHEGHVFAEGRAGSDYKIRIKNSTGSRTCFVVSVDGLSVMNGKPCANDSPGYILGPWESLDIACYKVDDQTGAKFVFGDKGKSYSVQIGQGENNVGVIGAIVFRELVKPIHVHRPPPFRPLRRWDEYDYPRRYGGPLSRVTKTMSSNSTGNVGALYASSNSVGSSSLFEINSSGAAGSVSSECCVRGDAPTAVAASTTAGTVQENEIEKLGTVFGGAMEWKTETVKFQRESSAIASMAIFYDTRKNLERRGVKLEHKVPPLPNAFPGNEGCPTPTNWQK